METFLGMEVEQPGKVIKLHLDSETSMDQAPRGEPSSSPRREGAGPLYPRGGGSSHAGMRFGLQTRLAL